MINAHSMKRTPDDVSAFTANERSCFSVLQASGRARRLHCFWFCCLCSGILAFVCGVGLPAHGEPAREVGKLATTPPMGWNDWAHYECNFTAKTILDNAHALVKSGLAARGYNTVTIDDCWMQKDRDAQGELQVDPQRFPLGMAQVAQTVHALGLKFGIYEDAGYATCGGFAGSGEPNGGGKDHFLKDAKLFASWGVDYLKLDGCNVFVPKGGDQNAAYRKAYAAQNKALRAVGRTVVFSESAPAYFQGTPAWYDVLSWVQEYGQLWREGDDIETYHPKKPDMPRFHSVLWNYAYNLPLGRFQKPGNWNDADFIIGGDSGMSLPETRSQVALWSMMSAPLILSSNVSTLTPEALGVVGNKAVIAIDQDAFGKEATLVQRSADQDVLFKHLRGGDFAVAVVNRGSAQLQVSVAPEELGFAGHANCKLQAEELWNGTQTAPTAMLTASLASHDTAIWRIHPSASCGAPTSTGTITMIATGQHEDIDQYSHCLKGSGTVGACSGSPAEVWTITGAGALTHAGQCLADVGGKPSMQACTAGRAQKWHYSLVGNLISADNKCLTASGPDSAMQTLSVEACGHNRPDQIWSLPN